MRRTLWAYQYLMDILHVVQKQMRFTHTIDRFLCLSLRTNLGPLIPSLVKRLMMTMGNLFQVFAGEGNLTCLLRPIQVDVLKYYRWFKGKFVLDGFQNFVNSCSVVLATQANAINLLQSVKGSFDILSSSSQFHAEGLNSGPYRMEE